MRLTPPHHLTSHQTPTTDSATTSPAGSRCPHLRRWLVVGALAALMLVSSASAAGAAPTTVLALAGSVTDVLTNIRTWLMGILAAVATVFLTIGGLRYVMAAGDPGEVEKAKTAFKSAGIGYGLAALAPLIVTVLQGIVGA